MTLQGWIGKSVIGQCDVSEIAALSRISLLPSLPDIHPDAIPGEQGTKTREIDDRFLVCRIEGS